MVKVEVQEQVGRQSARRRQRANREAGQLRIHYTVAGRADDTRAGRIVC